VYELAGVDLRQIKCDIVRSLLEDVSGAGAGRLRTQRRTKRNSKSITTSSTTRNHQTSNSNNHCNRKKASYLFCFIYSRENFCHRHASRHTLRGERLIRVSSREPSLAERARNRQLCVTCKFLLCFTVTKENSVKFEFPAV
jgi:hypothetical protein